MSTKKMLYKNKRPIAKPIVLIPLVAILAAYSAYGFSLLTGKQSDSGTGYSYASIEEPADLNNDGTVDVFDLSAMLSAWGMSSAVADINGDGTVNIYDLSRLLTKWGEKISSQAALAPGAKLPISYTLSSLTGTKRYVATTGSDNTGTGTIGSPYATIKKAESVSADGDTIIVRGGTYPVTANALTIDRSGLTVIAYPGETPIFDGSIPAPASSTAEGSLRYFRYQPMPAAVGEGLGLSNLPAATFSGTIPTGQAAERGWRCVTGASSYVAPSTSSSSDPSGCSSNRAVVITGYYPDQVWVNGTALTQVLDKAKVGPGKFWLNRTSASDASPVTSNLYLSSTDAADMSKVRVSSSNGYFIKVAAPDVTLAGFKIINNSPSWNMTTLLLSNNSATLENIALESNASGGIKIARGNTPSTLASGNTLRNVTVTRSGWTGMVLYYNNDTTMDSVLFSHNEPDLEFYTSPQRGAIKATKSDRTKIVNSAFEYNTIGVWFDQSNYDADIADSRFYGNSDSAVFYEISHALTLVNNYINGHGGRGAAVRLAGASDLKLVNNTIIGGKDVIWMGTDARSKTFVTSSGQVRDCSEHTSRYGQGGDPVRDCWVGYSSDFDVARPGAYSPTGATNLTPGMDWNNSFTLFINNIVADSDGANQCGSTVPLCVNGYINWNSSSGLIHQQVDLRSIFPRTLQMTGNLYQSSSGKIAMIRADSSVSQPGGFTAADLSALRGSLGFGSVFYGLNVEANGISAASGLVDAQGVVSSSVSHAAAAAVPVDPDINQYIPAGIRHYGILK